MRKYGSKLFIVIVLIFVGWFAYGQITAKLNESKNAKLIKTATSSSHFVNPAQEKTLTASHAGQTFTVGQDIKAGYYDISTQDNLSVISGVVPLAASQGNTAYNIPVLNGDEIQFSGSGAATFTPSKLAKLTQVSYQGAEVYQIPGQGFYFVGSQIPEGKYQLLYENLPPYTSATAAATEPDIQIAKTNLAYASMSLQNTGLGGVNGGDVNGTDIGKQQNPVIDLKGAKMLEIIYMNPPADLKVYLKEVN